MQHQKLWEQQIQPSMLQYCIYDFQDIPYFFAYILKQWACIGYYWVVMGRQLIAKAVATGDIH